MPDGLSDEVAQQHRAGAGKGAEQTLRIEGDAVAVVHMVVAQQREVDLARNVALQRGPAGFRAEYVEDEPVEASHARDAQENAFGLLEDQGQESAQDVAHGDAL